MEPKTGAKGIAQKRNEPRPENFQVAKLAVRRERCSNNGTGQHTHLPVVGRAGSMRTADDTCVNALVACLDVSVRDFA